MFFECHDRLNKKKLTSLHFQLDNVNAFVGDF